MGFLICNNCKGEEINHDAVAHFNQETGEFDSFSLIGQWNCIDCGSENIGEVKNDSQN